MLPVDLTPHSTRLTTLFAPPAEELIQKQQTEVKLLFGRGVYVPAGNYEERELWLEKFHAEELQNCLKKNSSLTTLRINQKPWTRLSKEIAQCTQLTTLAILNTPLLSLPAELGAWTQLKSLILFKTQIRELPPTLGQLQKLEKLELNSNELEHLEALSPLTHLIYLSASRNKIRHLPSGPSWENLQTLFLDDNALSELPEKLYGCTSLTCLNLEKNPLLHTEEMKRRFSRVKALFL